MRTLFARHPEHGSAPRPGRPPLTPSGAADTASDRAAAATRREGEPATSSGSFPRRLSAAALAIAWAAALAGCGGAASPAALKVDSNDPEADLAQAEAAIYGRFQPSSQGYPAPPATASSGPEASPPTPAQAPRHAPEAQEAQEDESGAADDACEVACDALASMQRAVERICAIAGSTADRCARARERLTRARETVESRCETCDT